MVNTIKIFQDIFYQYFDSIELIVKQAVIFLYNDFTENKIFYLFVFISVIFLYWIAKIFFIWIFKIIQKTFLLIMLKVFPLILNSFKNSFKEFFNFLKQLKYTRPTELIGSYSNEEELENLLEREIRNKNFNIPLKILKRQYSFEYADKRKGRMDFLAKNTKTNGIVIIEVKAESEERLYDQVVSYPSWVAFNMDKLCEDFPNEDINTKILPEMLVISDIYSDKMRTVFGHHNIKFIQVKNKLILDPVFA